MNKLMITRGTNKKPAISEVLIRALQQIDGLYGQFFTGYPLIATPDGKYSFDAILVSPSKGIIIFDLIEGNSEVGDYKGRQDDLVNKLEAKLKLSKDLVQGRKLKIDISVLSFVSSPLVQETGSGEYPIVNEENLTSFISGLGDVVRDDEIYQLALSTIESLGHIRNSRTKREVKNENSRGAKLKALESSIATLDHQQNKAVIETVQGVQRIRGLAGSGKTIVLAMKAAYLHTQNPDWRIAVTFHTRSLKEQFKKLIYNFCIQNGEEPNWEKIKIVNAWGGRSSIEDNGIYYEFCQAVNVRFFDFKSASNMFGGGVDAFDGACKYSLNEAIDKLGSVNIPDLYNVILVDEAQDFSSGFLKLCYTILDDKKRLVYAYDELQNLSGTSLPSPEEIFGDDSNGRPLVRLDDDGRHDIILQKCYRNSRPVLISAHSLGFGIYRDTPLNLNKRTGLVQMFDYPNLWKEIGYKVYRGELQKGENVILERTNENSPKFLEEHSEIDDLVKFIQFDTKEEHDNWLISQIEENLGTDELRYDDIVVINPEPRTTRQNVGNIRSILFNKGIQTHLAGVDTSADVFFSVDQSSITFTGIYRAKGNEAGMVYVINAQESNGDGSGLATLRNRLFTAITRSKAWVRVIGYGEKMKGLIDEFEKLKKEKFRLDFKYPTDEILKELRIVHRDLSEEEKRKLTESQKGIESLIEDIASGTVNIEHLEGIEKLMELLTTKKSG